MTAAVQQAKLKSSDLEKSSLNVMNLRAKNVGIKQKFFARNASKEFIESERESQ